MCIHVDVTFLSLQIEDLVSLCRSVKEEHREEVAKLFVDAFPLIADKLNICVEQLLTQSMTKIRREKIIQLQSRKELTYKGQTDLNYLGYDKTHENEGVETASRGLPCTGFSGPIEGCKSVVTEETFSQTFPLTQTQEGSENTQKTIPVAKGNKD